MRIYYPYRQRTPPPLDHSRCLDDFQIIMFDGMKEKPNYIAIQGRQTPNKSQMNKNRQLL